MFGKGVYFADMVSKSGQSLRLNQSSLLLSRSFLANYCFATRDAPDGLLLLCEVALGKMCECYTATTLSAENLPTGTQSTKGCGQTVPDPKGISTSSFVFLSSLSPCLH